MSAHPIRHVLVPRTRASVREAVLGSFAFLHFVDTGERLLLHDGERRMEVDIILSSSGDTAEGAPESVEFCFVGYTEEVADELVGQYLKNTLRKHGE